MRVFHELDAFREWRGGWEAPKATLALVPTMGYLHEGHLFLVDRARASADAVVLTVFVNPLQFGPGEDLADYPRDLERDLLLAGGRGVDVVLAPAEAAMYPEGEPVVTVDPGPMADGLCGRFRPGHFRGVLTVVAKLFGIVRPGLAVFGRKDYQQGILVRRMVTDLDLGVEIDLAPIVRESDGLAISSRNAYLSPEERAQAPGLQAGLWSALERFRAGERRPEALARAVRDEVERRPMLRLQYVEVVDAATLAPVTEASPGAVLAVAGHCGTTRLIDNVTLEEA